jgi:hypothetical protein
MSLSQNYPTTRPTLTLDFAKAKRVDPRVTFTRASTATYFDASGTLRSAQANVPRIDFNPSTLLCQGLLIEEQRTNLLTNSADFSSAFGVVGTSLTVTSDVTTSPDGGTNADSVVESAATEIHYAIKDFSITGNATYSFSVFVKNFSGSRYVGLRLSNTIWSNRINAIFDLSTGTWVSAPSNVGTATGATGAIQDVGNGWYRVTITGLPDPAAATVRLTVALSNSSASSLPSYAGDGTSGIYIWGAQLEVGAFPTSYIPTTTTSLTRSADVARVTTLSPWFNASEGTIYAESLVLSITNQRIASFNDGSVGNRIIISRGTGSGGNVNGNVSAGGSPQVSALTFGTSIPAATITKAAFAYKLDDFAGSVNGGAAVADTSGTIPTVNILALGSGEALGTNSLNGYLRRITYYNTRLPNAQLQALTAP